MMLNWTAAKSALSKWRWRKSAERTPVTHPVVNQLSVMNMQALPRTFPWMIDFVRQIATQDEHCNCSDFNGSGKEHTVNCRMSVANTLIAKLNEECAAVIQLIH
jgi:hypothetical protein